MHWFCLYVTFIPFFFFNFIFSHSLHSFINEFLFVHCFWHLYSFHFRHTKWMQNIPHWNHRLCGILWRVLWWLQIQNSWTIDLRGGNSVCLLLFHFHLWAQLPCWCVRSPSWGLRGPWWYVFPLFHHFSPSPSPFSIILLYCFLFLSFFLPPLPFLCPSSLPISSILYHSLILWVERYTHWACANGVADYYECSGVNATCETSCKPTIEVKENVCIFHSDFNYITVKCSSPFNNITPRPPTSFPTSSPSSSSSTTSAPSSSGVLVTVTYILAVTCIVFAMV